MFCRITYGDHNEEELKTKTDTLRRNGPVRNPWSEKEYNVKGL